MRNETGDEWTLSPRLHHEIPRQAPSLKILPVELPTTRRQTGIITLKNRALSPLAQLFIECARDFARPLAKGQAPSGRAKTISGP